MRIANSGHLRAGQKHGRREEESGSVAAASEAQHSAALNYFRLHQHRCSYGLMLGFCFSSRGQQMMDGNDMGGGRKMGAEARLGTQHVRSAGKRSGLHDESHGVLVSSVDVTDGNVHGHRPPV
ncbi:unnamed protein product [Urochloa humidicola]